VAKLELKDVFFLGAVSDAELRELYRKASVFVLTPQQEGLHFEGFGLVYLEAGAYGLPVVGTSSGGVPDAVQDGVTGLLVDPQDVEGAAQALLRLLHNPELRREMGRANRRLSEALTWERCAAEYDRAYRSVLEAR
jgi:glycosyltransferase involved in cell wall biosynthesis